MLCVSDNLIEQIGLLNAKETLPHELEV